MCGHVSAAIYKRVKPFVIDLNKYIRIYQLQRQNALGKSGLRESERVGHIKVYVFVLSRAGSDVWSALNRRGVHANM